MIYVKKTIFPATSTLDTSGGQESSVLSVNKQQQSALKSRKKLSDLVENGTSQTSTEHILTTERLQQHTALHQVSSIVFHLHHHKFFVP